MPNLILFLLYVLVLIVVAGIILWAIKAFIPSLDNRIYVLLQLIVVCLLLIAVIELFSGGVGFGLAHCHGRLC